MKFWVMIWFPVITSAAFAQSENQYISNGNDLYRQSRFDAAEIQYRQALKTNPNSTAAKRNLANALMQQKKFKEAITLNEEVINSNADKDAKAIAYYNSGVGYSKQRDLQSSIAAYKSALRINAGDKQARENLQKALSELKKQQSDQKKQQNNKPKINPKDAEDKLRQLQQKERDAQKRMQDQKKGKGGNREKDW